MPTPARQPVYPIPLRDADDARFTFTEILTAHGYPPVRTPADLVRWQQALFTTIYQQKETP
jgi:hypothetical protein